MKTIQLLTVAFLATAVNGYSQLALHQGESWTYTFNTLPQTGFAPAFGASPNGLFQFFLQEGSFQTGDRLFYEMFETSSSGQPLASGEVSSAVSMPVSSQVDYAWQDLQGVIRLTMLAGSVTIDRITLQAVVAGPSLSQYEVHSDSFVPVPEPGACGLLALGIVFGGLWLRRR